jgi:DNA-binding CsgD family transcriptional regulator
MTLFLTIVNYAADEWCAEILERPQTLGRSSNAEVVLPAEFGSVSRLHAAVWADRRGGWIKDLDSKAGTCLNGVPLRSGEQYELRAGDQIWLGDAVLESVSADSRKELLKTMSPSADGGDDAETYSPPKAESVARILDKLSHAEIELLLWLRRGIVSQEELGRKLHRSPMTVKTQLSSIFKKLGVHSREELVGHLVRHEPKGAGPADER